jgi:hypothetical protein
LNSYFLSKKRQRGVISFSVNHPTQYRTYVQFLPSHFHTSAGKKKGILKTNPFKKECEKDGAGGFVFGGFPKKGTKKGLHNLAIPLPSALAFDAGAPLNSMTIAVFNCHCHQPSHNPNHHNRRGRS